MFQKKYKITSKIKRNFIKLNSLENLLERYIEHDNHHRAIQTSELFQIQKNKAWETVFEIYPSLKGKSVSYITPGEYITWRKK